MDEYRFDRLGPQSITGVRVPSDPGLQTLFLNQIFQLLVAALESRRILIFTESVQYALMPSCIILRAVFLIARHQVEYLWRNARGHVIVSPNTAVDESACHVHMSVSIK